MSEQKQPKFELIAENKPVSPCLVHQRELLVDLYNQANNNPGGPWVIQFRSIDTIKFACKLCGMTRTYKQSTEKTLL